MDDVMGIPMKKFIELILAILVMTFLLIEKVGASLFLVMIIMVVVYLILCVIMGLARKGDVFGNGPGVETAFGVYLMAFSISDLYNGARGMPGLIVAAHILNLVMDSLFLFANLC